MIKKYLIETRKSNKKLLLEIEPKNPGPDEEQLIRDEFQTYLYYYNQNEDEITSFKEIDREPPTDQPLDRFKEINLFDLKGVPADWLNWDKRYAIPTLTNFSFEGCGMKYAFLPVKDKRSSVFMDIISTGELVKEMVEAVNWTEYDLFHHGCQYTMSGIKPYIKVHYIVTIMAWYGVSFETAEKAYKTTEPVIDVMMDPESTGFYNV